MRCQTGSHPRREEARRSSRGRFHSAARSTGLLHFIELGLKGRDLRLERIHLAGHGRVRRAARELGGHAHELAFQGLDLLADALGVIAGRGRG